MLRVGLLKGIKGPGGIKETAGGSIGVVWDLVFHN